MGNREIWNENIKNKNILTATIPTDKNDDYSNIWMNYRTKIEIKHLLKKVDLADKTILDLGCGSGRMSFEFAKTCKHVIGLDFAESAIELANNFKKEKNINNAEFYVADISTFEENKSFDIIFIGGVLMCLNDDVVQLLLHKVKPLMSSSTLLINRDTISFSKRFTSKELPNRKDFTVYRTLDEYLEIFKADFRTIYTKETYPFLITMKLFNAIKIRETSSKFLLFLFDLSLRFQLLTDPFLLKYSSIYSRPKQSWSTRQFYMFHKLKIDSK